MNLYLSLLIAQEIETNHRGKENAIKRKDLLTYVHAYGDPEMTDRELRRTIKTIPIICTFERGYFVATSKEESDYSIEYLKKKIFPLWENIKNIQLAYPQYYQDEQMELF